NLELDHDWAGEKEDGIAVGEGVVCVAAEGEALLAAEGGGWVVAGLEFEHEGADVLALLALIVACPAAGGGEEHRADAALSDRAVHNEDADPAYAWAGDDRDDYVAAYALALDGYEGNGGGLPA